jgi:hypothetical protein
VQLGRAVQHITANPGIVFTLVEPDFSPPLEAECARLGVPCVSILTVPSGLGKFLGAEETHRPGGQHEMDCAILNGWKRPTSPSNMMTARTSRIWPKPTLFLWCQPQLELNPHYLAIRGVQGKYRSCPAWNCLSISSFD